ncbi:MAG: hypothetical protein OXK74_01470 [Gemmatimonadota bacterium]|nr:hypothetical protein [Gemmatimonadota bacterium]
MTAADDMPAWVHRLEERDRRIVVERARREPEFRCRVFTARRTATRRKLVEQTHSWASGQVLRAILEEQREYWARVSKGLNGRLAELRTIHNETGHETITVREEVDDEMIELLRPLVARAIDTAAPGGDVDLPGGYWLRCELQGGDLVGGIGHGIGGETVLAGIWVQPATADDIAVLTVSTVGLQSAFVTDGGGRLFRVASQLGDLELFIAWAWLELRRQEMA